MLSLYLRSKRVLSFAWVALAYIIALLFGYFSLSFFSGLPVLWQVFFADIVTTCIIFLFSFALSNSSIYDPYWSVIPPFITAFWIFTSTEDANLWRQIIILALISTWGLRLTLNWARGWQGLPHEDWRYRNLAEKTGKAYWWVSFAGIHLFPTLIVFLGCLPLIYSLNSSKPLELFDVVAILVTSGAIITETTADEQLKRFKRKNREGLMKYGIWAYSRHPNYFGEITFWLGIFLFSANSDSLNYLWTSVGFFAMVVLFVFISIPMMEKRMEDKKPEFSVYKKQVSMLLPIPRRLIIHK